MTNGLESLGAIKPDISSRLQKVGLNKEQILILSDNIEKVYNAILRSLATNIKFRTKFFEDPLTAIKKYRKELSRFTGLGKVKRRASKKISGVPVERVSANTDPQPDIP